MNDSFFSLQGVIAVKVTNVKTAVSGKRHIPVEVLSHTVRKVLLEAWRLQGACLRQALERGIRVRRR